MAQIASLVPQTVAIPQRDYSWLDGLGETLGGIGKEASARKSFGALADRIGGGNPAAAPQGGFLSRLTGEPTSAPSAPVGRVERGQFSTIAPRLISDLSRDFNLTPEQAAGVVGQLGHESAGFGTLQEVKPVVEGSRGGYGYAQWTGPRRNEFEQWSAQNGLSPDSYEANYGFLAHELKNTPEGKVLDSLRSAPDALSAGRAFTDGFLRPGIPGYNSRDNWTRRALAFAGQPSQPTSSADAVNAMADGSLASAYAPEAPASPAQAAVAQAAPMQVADAGNGIIAQGITPIQRGGVDTDTIKFMLRDPNLREAGLKLWAANVQGQNPGEPWQFVTLPDGTLARANQQSGQIERIGNFAKPQEQYRVLSQDERAAAGIPPEDNRPYQISPQGQISAVGGVGQSTNAGVEARNREALARQYGIDPNSAEGQRFILTGTLPSSDKGVTAGDREAIRDADDAVQTGENTLGLLDKALELSPKAYEGWGADARAIAGSQIGLEGANATREFDNIVKEQALGQLKQIFGGAPTEGERAILLEIQGASSQPQAVRENILRRARALVERKIAYNRDRANELRGGTYYRPREEGAPSDGQPKANGQRKTSTGVQWSIEE